MFGIRQRNAGLWFLFTEFCGRSFPALIPRTFLPPCSPTALCSDVPPKCTSEFHFPAVISVLSSDPLSSPCHHLQNLCSLFNVPFGTSESELTLSTEELRVSFVVAEVKHQQDLLFALHLTSSLLGLITLTPISKPVTSAWDISLARDKCHWSPSALEDRAEPE